MSINRALGWRDAIIGRMLAVEAEDTSDAEIERTLRPCVCGRLLVEAAKSLRDAGMLDLDLQLGHNQD